MAKHLFEIIILIIGLMLVSCRNTPEYIDSYVISKNGRYGLIDSLGNEIVSPRFLYIEPIQKSGVALAVIDTIYTSAIDTIAGNILYKHPVLNIKYGYITGDDKFLFSEPSYAKINITTADIKLLNFTYSLDAFPQFCKNFSFYGGLAVTQDTTTMLYGYIGLNGDIIISPKYLSAKKFNQGRAAVRLNNNEKWGLIDATGNEVCDFVFRDIETPYNDRAIAKIDFKTACLVNEDGKIINQLDNAYIYSNYSKEGIAVRRLSKLVIDFLGADATCYARFIDKSGDFLQPIDANDFKDNAQRIIDSEYFLNELFPHDIVFDDATCFSEGYAAVSLNHKWVFVDTQLIPRGNKEYPVFEYATPFSHGLAGVKLNGKFGYINHDFEFITQCKYDSVATAGKNLCMVYSGNKTDDTYSITSYINRKNEIVWQNVDCGNYFADKDFPEQNGKWCEFEYICAEKYYIPILPCIGFALIAVIVIISLILNNRNRKENDNANPNPVKTNLERPSIEQRLDNLFK